MTNTPRDFVSVPREARQIRIAEWCKAAFGDDHATNIEQRGLRLAEEAIEAAQAGGCDPATLHKLIDYIYAKEPGELSQELGGVGLCVLAMANAAGVWADAAEESECQRVLSKPLEFFAARNKVKNDAGFVSGAYRQPVSTAPTPPVAGEDAKKAAQILADVRAGTHKHGDIRDVGKLLDGKFDQDFPTKLLELAAHPSTVTSRQVLTRAEYMVQTIEQYISGHGGDPHGGHPGDEFTSLRAAVREFRKALQEHPATSREQGLEDIAAERRRQIEGEGWTSEHDDKHSGREMAQAAACYALCIYREDGIRTEPNPNIETAAFIKHWWPWDWSWWKPKGTRRNLVKAGALIVAEIERLDRMTTPHPNAPQTIEERSR